MSAPLCVPLLVLGVGFEPTSPRFQRGAVTRSAFRAVSWSRGRELNPRARFCRPADRRSRHRDEDGADGGNRTRIAGVALRGWTFQLHPHGGKRRESNLLPHRDCVYGAATAPAVLMGASRETVGFPRCVRLRQGYGGQLSPRSGESWRRAEGSNLGPRGPLGFRDRLPATPAALSELECISQDSNLDPVPYEGTALPIELEMQNWSARQDSNLRSPAPEAGALPG